MRVGLFFFDCSERAVVFLDVIVSVGEIKIRIIQLARKCASFLHVP